VIRQQCAGGSSLHHRIIERSTVMEQFEPQQGARHANGTDNVAPDVI
jgi:hypothetical protein